MINYLPTILKTSNMLQKSKMYEHFHPTWFMELYVKFLIDSLFRFSLADKLIYYICRNNFKISSNFLRVWVSFQVKMRLYRMHCMPSTKVCHQSEINECENVRCHLIALSTYTGVANEWGRTHIIWYLENGEQHKLLPTVSSTIYMYRTFNT